MTTPTILRGSTRADLLCIPSIMLGFHPSESLVVLGTRGARVEFCARLDIDIPDVDLRRAAAQVRRAGRGVRGTAFILLGYGGDVAGVAEAAEHLRHLIGSGVRQVVVTDGHRCWDLEGGILLRAAAFSFAQSALAAHAVYEGLRVSASRDEAVAEVLPPPGHLRPQIAERVDSAAGRVVQLHPDEQLQLLGSLLEADEPLAPEDAAELVSLLRVPQCQAELLAQLNTATAARVRRRLVEARATADEDSEADVLGALAVACWLAGEGAQQIECMLQLQKLAPGHPFLGALEALHQAAVPPDRWDSG